MTTNEATAIGEKIGKAIVRDTLAEGMPREWTGLDAQDADVAIEAGLVPDSEEWTTMERAAKEAFERLAKAN